MVPVLRILSHAPMFWALPVPTLPEVLAVLFLGRTFSAGGQPSEGTLSAKFRGYSMVNPGTHKSSRFFWEVNQFGPRKHILKAEIFVHCSNCSNPMMRREEERLPIWRLGRSWQILADLGRSWQHDMNQFLVIVIAMLATSIGPSDSTADRSCPALWFDFYGWEVIYSSTSSLEKRATNLEIFPNSLEEKCKKPSEISQVGENLGRLGT